MFRARDAAFWDALGERDPFWAALTGTRQQPSHWDAASFYASGEREVAALLARLDQHGIRLHYRRAIDVGCGPGRITHALAQRFAVALGVDVSRTMLRVARACRYPRGAVLVMADGTDLAALRNQQFDLVFCARVLQHLEPRDARAALAALARMVAPEGTLVVQVPTHPVNRARRLVKRLLPVSVQRLYRMWRRCDRARMGMFGLTPAVVTRGLERSGLQVVAIHPDDRAAPDWLGFEYWARRPPLEPRLDADARRD